MKKNLPTIVKNLLLNKTCDNCRNRDCIWGTTKRTKTCEHWIKNRNCLNCFKHRKCSEEYLMVFNIDVERLDEYSCSQWKYLKE